MQAATPAPRITPQQQDAMATRSILAQALERIQQVGNSTVFPASNPQLLITPVNVGLVKRFTIIVSGTITNSGSTTLTLTDFGLANLFSTGGVQYTDLNNYLRVNTSGQHLSLLATAKRRHPFGSTAQFNTVNGTSLSQMLNVPPAAWPVFTAPQTIASGATVPFRAVFELPLAYSDDDLRGAVYANVLNAIQQITLQFNTAIVSVGTADNTFAVYQGAAGSAGNISSATVVVYQHYLDQLPMAQTQGGGVSVLLPQLSLSTVYELKTTLLSAVTANQEFAIAYANSRSFISTFCTFNNNGTSTGRAFGTDVNYWALLTANASYVWKYDPLTAAMFSRGHLLEDIPAGTYYFSTRKKNIASMQYGNLQLILNASTATAAGYVNVMWEDFALQNTLQGGSSLASS